MNRRSVAFGISKIEKIPPINKIKIPKTPMINVTGRNSAIHDSRIRHAWKRPYKIMKDNSSKKLRNTIHTFHP
jgi:hypothetical protein